MEKMAGDLLLGLELFKSQFSQHMTRLGRVKVKISGSSRLDSFHDMCCTILKFIPEKAYWKSLKICVQCTV